MILGKFSKSVSFVFNRMTKCNNLYTFADKPSLQTKIAKIKQQALNFQTSQKQYLKQLQYDQQIKKYLAEGLWNMTRKQRIITLQREFNGYHIKAHFSASVQKNQDQQQNKNDQNKSDQTTRLQNLFVLISKDAKHWLYAIYFIEDDNVQMGCINFTNNPQKIAQELITLKFLSKQYSGPRVETLSSELTEGVQQLFQSLGINKDFFQSVLQIAQAQEINSNIDWVNDFISKVL